MQDMKKDKSEEKEDIAVGEAKDEHEALRTVTGNLSSQPLARDVKFVEFRCCPNPTGFASPWRRGNTLTDGWLP